MAVLTLVFAAGLLVSCINVPAACDVDEPVHKEGIFAPDADIEHDEGVLAFYQKTALSRTPNCTTKTAKPSA